MKRILPLLLALVLLCAVPASAATTGGDALPAAVQAVRTATPAPQFGSIGGEWAVLALARSGADVPASVWDAYRADLSAYLAAHDGVLHAKKYTDYSRVVLALTALGEDPADFDGWDLLAPLSDVDKVCWQGVNGPIWALIALDAGGYDSAARETYLAKILAAQRPDGGWSLSGASDPDLTAMALQALAGYRDRTDVGDAAARGLACLSALQDARGGFSSGGTANAESCAQVLIALAALGIAPDDARFVKDGHSALDRLLTFQRPDGGFRHTDGGTGDDRMAAEQALLALVALDRAADGRSGLYQMDDVARSDDRPSPIVLDPAQRWALLGVLIGTARIF